MRQSWEIQRAVYAALRAEPPLPVYDEVPPDVEAPYIALGLSTEVPDDAHGEYGTSETMTLHVWSRGKGAKQAKEIMAAIDERLHNVILPLTDGSVHITRSFAELLDEEAEVGERWRHGVVRYRIRTQEVT